MSTNQFQVLETFIKETGQEKGSVSGDMALQALEIIKQAVSKEREECAKVADDILNQQGESHPYRNGYRDAALAIGRRIRARSNEQNPTE